MSTKRYLGAIFLLVTSVMTWAQGAYSFKINEVVISNKTGLVDEYGDRSAWIEITNTAWSTNELGSCYLTNDRRTLDEHLTVSERIRLMSLIPRGDNRTQLGAKGSIVFFADSNANRGTLHTAFKLVPGKENFIALFDGNGKTLLDTITIPGTLKDDESYARLYDAESKTYVWQTLKAQEVTPGRPNAGNGKHGDNVAEFKEKDPYGIGMAVIAMTIVLASLFLLYLFFRIQGRIVNSLQRVTRFKTINAMRKKAKKAIILAQDGMETKGVSKNTYVAVIAMALSEYEDEIHDLESGRITIIPHETAWNNKRDEMKNRMV